MQSSRSIPLLHYGQERDWVTYSLDEQVDGLSTRRLGGDAGLLAIVAAFSTTI